MRKSHEMNRESGMSSEGQIRAVDNTNRNWTNKDLIIRNKIYNSICRDPSRCGKIHCLYFSLRSYLDETPDRKHDLFISASQVNANA